MKRIWIGVLAAVLLLSACGKAEKLAETAPAQEYELRLDRAAETEKDGIILRADAYENGQLLIHLSNRSGNLWYYGEGFALYRRNEEGWSSVPDDRSWIAIAYELEDGDDVSLACDLAPLQLTAGSYKLVKDGIELPFRLIQVVIEK